MIQKRQLLINAAMSVTQTIVVGVMLFVLYRYLLKMIGVKQLGIWSLVVATTSISQIANFGLSGSVVKFAARYIAHGEDEKVSGVIQTGVISIAVFIGIVLVVAYPVAKQALNLVIPPESVATAYVILPFAFFAFWLLMVTGSIQAGLEGYQRNDLKSLVLVSGSLINLILCFVFAPSYGLMGVAYARVIENLSDFVFSWILLKRQLSLLPLIPYRWNKTLFREILGYGINVQLMTGITMLYDPITKAFLSRFGGLAMVGYYEMAGKMVWQIRGLIVSANQVLVPAIANLQEWIPEKIRDVYLISYRLLFYLSVPVFSAVVVCTPIISELWIGHYEHDFILFAMLLSAGWLINTLSAPAYFANMGIGDLRWNTISHFAIAILNAGLGYVLGLSFAGSGVVVSWIISLAIGSSLISVPYHKKNGISLRELFPRESRTIVISCLSGMLLLPVIYGKLRYSLNTIPSNIIIICMFSVIIIFPLWAHPMRKKLSAWICHELFSIRGVK
jgi:O-antigen/teichoic acid export membrane protein